MTTHNSIQTIDGQLRRVEHVIYSNGSQVKRMYNSFDSKVPFEIIWASNPKPVKQEDVIEHREVTLMNHYFCK
jgi:trans-2-enoyl-CoA reductase